MGGKTDVLAPSLARQIARAASDLHRERTGRTPLAVDVVLSGEILLITMQGALSQADTALAASPQGAARFQELHRQRFRTSAERLRQEIQRVTGCSLRTATANGGPTQGAMVQVFTNGTVSLVFLLARSVPARDRSGEPVANGRCPGRQVRRGPGSDGQRGRARQAGFKP